MRNRVVITGLGCVTPLGSDVHQVWNRLTEGQSGVGRLTLFDASRFPVQIAAEVKDWSIAEVGEDPERWRHHPRQTLFAVASGINAIRSAGFEGRHRAAQFDPLRFGVYLGCGETYQDWNQFAADDGALDGRRRIPSGKIHRASAAALAARRRVGTRTEHAGRASGGARSMLKGPMPTALPPVPPAARPSAKPPR